MIKDNIINKIKGGEKLWCVLIDPDKILFEKIGLLVSLINRSSCDYILSHGLKFLMTL